MFDFIQSTKAQIVASQQRRDAHIAFNNIINGDMPREERKAVAMAIKPISDDLWDTIQRYGIKTGSEVYGNIDNPGDQDWIVELPAYAFVNQQCGIPCVSNMSDYIDERDTVFQSVYGNRDGKLINVLCVGCGSFNIWKSTTEQMIALSKNPIFAEQFKTKWRRVRMFRAIMDTITPRPDRALPVLDLNYALEHHICAECHQEAVNFTTTQHRNHFEKTGICERCTSV